MESKEEKSSEVNPVPPGQAVASSMPDEALSDLETEELAAQSRSVMVPNAEIPNPKVWTVGTLVYTVSGLVLLFSWLLWGDFALSMRDRSVGPLIEKFLLINGAGNTLKQLLTATLPTTIGLILGPAISYMSDRTRSRWGRRIPFLIIPTPIAGLAMVGIAFSPQLGQWLYHIMGNTPTAGVSLREAASIYTLSIFAVLWTIFEVAVIISGSVFGGLINDVVPRTLLGRFHGLFRAVSLFDGILFNSLLFQHAEHHFTLMFALIGLLFGGGFMLMCLKVKEGTYPPPPPEEPLASTNFGTGVVARMFASTARFFLAAIGGLRECFSQPYYLLCFAMGSLAGLTFRPINDFSIRYAAQLGMPDSDYGFLNAISYVVSLTLAFPLGMLVDRFHPLRMAMLAMFLYALTGLYGALFVHDAMTFGIALIAHIILSGTYFTCSASLAQQLMPRSKYSQYASAGGIITSISGLVYAPIIGAILDMTRQNGPSNGTDGSPVTLYNYHLTFWGGLIFSLVTLFVLLLLHSRFMAYGGPKGYRAPGDDDAAPVHHEPPVHMAQIILLYLVGAAMGVAVGYLLAFGVQHDAASKAGLGLAGFHQLVIGNKDVRNMTTLCIATGVIPFAVLGGWAGAHLAGRKQASH